MLQHKLRQLREERAEADRGFTLIELLVVVVIIGILIAIAIPLYLNYQEGAKDKSAQSDLRAAVSTVQQCYTDNNNTYPDVPAGNGTEGSDLKFVCGPDATNDTETANVSDGTTLTYATTTNGFTLTAWNSGGHHSSASNDYAYDSSTGGSIGGAAPTATTGS